MSYNSIYTCLLYTSFHIERAMPALLRRKDIVRLTGRDELHIPLPGLVGTGIRQPAANQLSGRNGIGVYLSLIHIYTTESLKDAATPKA